MTTFSFDTDPITDLALPTRLDEQLTAALDSDDRDKAALVRAAVETAINEHLAESGWDGDWSAADIVTAVLAVADETDEIEDAIGALETQPCRTCGSLVPITRTDGSVDQTDGAGDIICDPCAADRGGLSATPVTLTIRHALREGAEHDHSTEQGTLLSVLQDDETVLDRPYRLPARTDDGGAAYWTSFRAADVYLEAWLRLHGVDPAEGMETLGSGWEAVFPRAAWR